MHVDQWLKPSVALMVVQVVVLVWLISLLTFGGLFRGQTLQAEIMTQSQENQLMERRNQRLMSQVDALRGDDLFLIEERARKDLGMVKDEETFFIFVD